MLSIKDTLRSGAVCLAVAGASAAAMAQEAVRSEPYAWDSVTIKANGFINGVVFSPVQKGLIYMHTDMGGAYRYDEAVSRWTCLTDFIQYDDFSLNQMGVETMAADPTDAGRVYAGVGTYMGPSAVLRSRDQGRTWQRTNVPFAMNGNGPARNTGERMNVDPNDPRILVYGTRNRGLWKSEDYAATWQRVDSFAAVGDTAGALRDTGVVWTLFDKASGTAGTLTPRIYAGVCTAGDPKVYRSDDAGKSWVAITGQPAEGFVTTRAALTPDGKELYLTYSHGGPGPYGANGGAVYKVAEPASAKPRWTDVTPAPGKHGWSGICLDPMNPQALVVSTLCRYGEVGDDVYRSTDGGKSWTALLVRDKANRDDSSAPYARSMGLHWLGDIQIDPFSPDRAIFTTGYGLYETRSLSKPTPKWVFFNEGFEQSAVLELVSPPVGSANLISAIGDRDGYRHEDFKVSPAAGLLGQSNGMAMGTCNSIAFAWGEPETMVRVGSQVQFSLDGGKTWARFAQFERSRDRGGPIAISADGKSVVLARGAGLFRASRNGQEFGAWTSVAGVPGRSFVLADTANPNRFYARRGSAFFASVDGGKSWSQVSSQVPEQGHWVRAIMGQEGHLWLGADDHGLFRSTDGGKTWAQVGAGVVSVARHVGMGAAAPGESYPAIFVAGTVGGRNGFFRSDDQGASWVQINDEAHHYGNVSVIQGDSRVFGRLYVGSNGRGVLYGERRG